MTTILNQFEKHILDTPPKTTSFHPFFNDALKQMLNAGGKRFRPELLFCVVDAFSPILVKNSFDVAYAIELLHTYSLIHDDLPSMDDASLRRGKETLHKTYDETTAILVGDALNTYAFNVLSNATLADNIKINLIKSLSYDGGIDGMIIGQAIDCYFENKNLNLEEIKFMHIHKTAKLIATSFKMGAIIVEEKKLEKELYEFGLELGLLFQVQDDIIDVTQNEKQSGKTVNNDLSKNSFIKLLGLKESINFKNELLKNLENKVSNFKNQKLKQYLVKILKKFN